MRSEHGGNETVHSDAEGRERAERRAAGDGAGAVTAGDGSSRTNGGERACIGRMRTELLLLWLLYAARVGMRWLVQHLSLLLLSVATFLYVLCEDVKAMAAIAITCFDLSVQ